MRSHARSLVVLGTASHAGKSAVVAGLCRLFRRRGVSVAPFKAQNMALNSSVTPSGGEIGRAQAMQAEAAGVEPCIEMNPILLKPSGQGRMQVVLRGKVYGTMTAEEYYREKPRFLAEALACHAALAERFDLIIAEGAGSATEVNLADRDIVNLPLARALDAPCLLVADIDRGGIFASVVGTAVLCDDDDRRRIRGFIVNKFRGERSLFADGVEFLEARTGWPCLGVLPHVDWLGLDEEDSVALESRTLKEHDTDANAFDVAVIRLPHLSNYTDFAPLEQSNVRVRYVDCADRLHGADLVVLPGTKNTPDDLLWLRQQGFEEALQRCRIERATILGVCGGYQMLGAEVRDPAGVESDQHAVRGLGLLDVETTMAAEKTTCQAEGVHLESGHPVRGYEIHMGRTTPRTALQPFARVLVRSGAMVDELDGVSAEGIHGTYLHGLFDNHAFTAAFLRVVAERRGKTLRYQSAFSKERVYDRWANLLEYELRLDLLGDLVGRPLGTTNVSIGR